MTSRIPPITTPAVGEDAGEDARRRFNSIWYRALLSLQNQIDSIVSKVDLGFSPSVDSGTITNSAGQPAVVPAFNDSDAGLVPAPGSSTGARFLRDDRVWASASGGGESYTFYYQDTAPSFPPAKKGDRWLDSFSGIYYVAVDDGNSNQWVEV